MLDSNVVKNVLQKLAMTIIWHSEKRKAKFNKKLVYF